MPLNKLNFKKLLSVVGLLTIAIPVSLSILAYGTTNQNNDKLIINAEQLVANAINKVDSYYIKVKVDSNIVELKSKINADFIKEQLSPDIQKIFKEEIYNINAFFKGKEKLNNEDLVHVEVINATIKYNYDQIKDQSVTLIIDVIKQ